MPSRVLALPLVVLAFWSCGCGPVVDRSPLRAAVERVRAGRADAISSGAVRLVTDDDLASLRGLTGLRHLVLDSTSVSDRGAGYLATLPDLESLSLSKCRVSDAGLDDLAAVAGLRFLRLDGLRVTDAGLAAVGRLRQLRTLSLFQCDVTDAGLVHLRGLPDLVVLSLDDTRVTAAGVRSLTDHLPRLRHLSVWRTRVEAGDAEELAALRPELRVNR